MKKSDLEKLKKDELLSLSKKLGIKISGTITKDNIIKMILSDQKKLSGEKQAKSQASNGKSNTKNETADIEDLRIRHGASFELKESETYNLPEEYGDTKITLLVQDPYWVHAYWEISKKDRKKFEIEKEGHHKSLIIRVYHAITNSYFDVLIHDNARSWYFNIPEPNKTYFAELGIHETTGKFLPIARSNVILVPTDKPAPFTGGNIFEKEELFRKSAGFDIQRSDGSQETTPQAGEWPAITGSAASRSITSGSITSGGVSSGRVSSGGVTSGGVSSRGITSGGVSSGRVSSGGATSGGVSSRSVTSVAGSRGIVPGKAVKKGFWADLQAELIVYGATEPDARVTIGGLPVRLGSDGRFSVRFYLKDGEYSIPFTAVAGDDSEVINITPFLSKHTERKDNKK